MGSLLLCFGYPRLPTELIILPTPTHIQVYFLENSGVKYTTYPQIYRCSIIYPQYVVCGRKRYTLLTRGRRITCR